MPQQLAQRMGVSRFVVGHIERGKPTTGVAAYVGALWALGLLAPLRDVADPDRDEEGKTLERARNPRTARPREKICGSCSDGSASTPRSPISTITRAITRLWRRDGSGASARPTI